MSTKIEQQDIDIKLADLREREASKSRSLVRLTPEVYADLEKRHTRLSVSATSTPIEVAFQLGVQSVLRDLRAGYVVQA